MRQEVAWLERELPGLVEHGVLTPETADALRRHYAADRNAPGVGWGQILLASFGALLVGGGIILILAHNWDALGRPARAAIALGLLLVAQTLAIYAVLRQTNVPAWTESTSAFLVAAVGAAIALVGQTYHVGGSFEGLMQAWLWLVVLIPYITGSSLASILFWALLLVRVTNLSWREAPWDPWLLVWAALPFVVIRLRRQPASWPTALVAMAAAVSIFVLGSIFTGSHGWHGLWAIFQVSFLSAVIAAAAWPPSRETIEPWRARLFVPASLGLIVVGTILTFDDVWRPITIAQRVLDNPSVAFSAVVAIACAAFASVVAVRLARDGQLAAACGAAAALLAVVMHAFSLLQIQAAGWIAFTLWLLAFGVLTLVEGVRRLTLWRANIGLLALVALIAARFFDTELSFLARGLAFVACGVGCLSLNVWLMRRMRARSAA